METRILGYTGGQPDNMRTITAVRRQTAPNAVGARLVYWTDAVGKATDNNLVAGIVPQSRKAAAWWGQTGYTAATYPYFCVFSQGDFTQGSTGNNMDASGNLQWVRGCGSAGAGGARPLGNYAAAQYRVRDLYRRTAQGQSYLDEGMSVIDVSFCCWYPSNPNWNGGSFPVWSPISYRTSEITETQVSQGTAYHFAFYYGGGTYPLCGTGVVEIIVYLPPNTLTPWENVSSANGTFTNTTGITTFGIGPFNGFNIATLSTDSMTTNGATNDSIRYYDWPIGQKFGLWQRRNAGATDDVTWDWINTGDPAGLQGMTVFNFQSVGIDKNNATSSIYNNFIRVSSSNVFFNTFQNVDPRTIN